MHNSEGGDCTTVRVETRSLPFTMEPCPAVSCRDAKTCKAWNFQAGRDKQGKRLIQSSRVNATMGMNVKKHGGTSLKSDT